MEFKIKNPTEADNERFEAEYKKYFGQESHKDCEHCNAQKEYEKKRSERFKNLGLKFEVENGDILVKQEYEFIDYTGKDFPKTDIIE
jgi:hypothetical protein